MKDLDAEVDVDGDGVFSVTIGLQRYLDDTARSFKIDGIGFKNFGGAAANVTARIWPTAKRNNDGKKNGTDLENNLSFEHTSEDPKFADDAREGAWLIVSDCVTYLLYPFVTCGDTQEWSTGLSVSNTSKDDRGFRSSFDETKEQSGSVILYGFPKSVATVNGSGIVPSTCCQS